MSADGGSRHTKPSALLGPCTCAAACALRMRTRSTAPGPQPTRTPQSDPQGSKSESSSSAPRLSSLASLSSESLPCCRWAKKQGRRKHCIHNVGTPRACHRLFRDGSASAFRSERGRGRIQRAKDAKPATQRPRASRSVVFFAHACRCSLARNTNLAAKVLRCLNTQNSCSKRDTQRVCRLCIRCV